jgi:GNAT superfamily N-acetyltransferase
MLAAAHHWIGLAWVDGVAIGVVTVTTMLYVEWGRLGEIGDLYVLPTARRKGIATALIDAAKAKCRELGCSAVSVVITPEGEARHGLTCYYERFGFVGSGRSIITHVLT